MTPQFDRRTHRAREHMEVLGRRVPDLWSLVEEVRIANKDEIGGPDWPVYCYLPLEHAGVIAATILRAQNVRPTPVNAARLGSQIAALSAWRMTQGIYRFDPAIYSALIDTPLDGEVPASILQHLPEWCVYVETPDLTAPTASAELPLRGAYAWLDRACGASHDTLTLLLDADGADLTVTHVPLIGTIQEALSSVTADWRDAYARGNAQTLPPHHFEMMSRQTLTPIVSLVLYLCAETSDINGRKGAPKNPQPIRTRRHGMRLFAANGPTTWDVGVRLGAALRRAYQREETNAGAESGRHQRAHVRRAHWHTFVLGPRKDPEKQRRALKWLPPIPVGISDYDDLPSTVRGVS